MIWVQNLDAYLNYFTPAGHTTYSLCMWPTAGRAIMTDLSPNTADQLFLVLSCKKRQLAYCPLLASADDYSSLDDVIQRPPGKANYSLKPGWSLQQEEVSGLPLTKEEKAVQSCSLLLLPTGLFFFFFRSSKRSYHMQLDESNKSQLCGPLHMHRAPLQDQGLKCYFTH